MGFQKKPTSNILAACMVLIFFFLLWRTFGVAEYASHAGSYHPTSALLTNTHLQTRHIKPQTLPKPKVAHPLSNGGFHLKARSNPRATTSHQLQSRDPSSNIQDVQPQAESSPKVEQDHTNMAARTADLSQSAPETQQEVQPAVVAQEPPKVVTCSQDMSLPCLPS